MIKWFLIGCAIVALIFGIPIIWYSLEWETQETVKFILALLVLSAIAGYISWYFYTGITS